MYSIFKYTLCLLFIFFACRERIDTGSMIGDLKMDQFSNGEIEAISNCKIFFSHMSVGNNILEGISDIQQRDPRFLKININQVSSTSSIDKKGIFHKEIGNNGNAKLKCDTFRDILVNQNLGYKIDIAMFKLCYVDFNENISVEDIFNHYVKTIEEIRNKFPTLRIIHITTPLTLHFTGLKSWLRNIIKGDIYNVKRNQYNNLLKERFKESDILFDLAKIESTYSDGGREYFKYKGNIIYSLIDQYTYDGGHLNHTGRTLAAKELLTVILKLVMSH
jgi:hypothetical protein